MKPQPKLFIVEFIVLIIILIICLKFVSGLENILDIGLFDESGYLNSGLQISNVGFPSAENSPLYALWYFLISLLEPNRIKLYYLSYKLTIVLLPIFVYGLLRRYYVPLSVSLVCSWYLLISRINALTWPRVSHFALLLILVTLILIGPRRSLAWSSLLASIGALIVSYVRPEYFLAFVLFTLLFALFFTRDYSALVRQYSLGLLVYILFSTVLLSELGIPVNGNRSMVAFGQHFSLNWVLRNGSNIDPWMNWTQIVSRNFGDVQSIAGAFFSNPPAFLTHIKDNLLHFLLSSPSLFFPMHVFLDTTSAVIIALLGIGLSATYLIVVHRTRTTFLIEQISKGWQVSKNHLILTSIFLLPALISAIIIYPRVHYLLIFDFLILLGIMIFLTNSFGKQEQLNLRNLLILSVLLIVLTPRFDQNLQGVQKPNLSTIEYIRSLRINQSVNLLGSDGGYDIYLGDNFHTIEVSEKNTNFDNFRIKRNINLIILSDTLINSTRFKDDPEWQGFLVDCNRFGYVQIEIPNIDRKIIVQNTLLQK